MFVTIQNVKHTTPQTIILSLLWILFGSIAVFAQDQEQADLGEIHLPLPSSVESQYTYDPESNRYIFSQEIGGYPISVPFSINCSRVSSISS